jgi:hypothetical protein
VGEVWGGAWGRLWYICYLTGYTKRAADMSRLYSASISVKGDYTGENGGSIYEPFEHYRIQIDLLF